MPVTLLRLIIKDRSRQQPLLQDGGGELVRVKVAALGKSLRAMPAQRFTVLTGVETAQKCI
jgi:hypothetical protein